MKPSAVDAAVKQTLASAFPGKTAGSIDQAKVTAEFKKTGMTRELLRHRIETKLLSAAAVKKVGGNPTVTEKQILAQYNKDKATTYALPERRKVRHILVKTKALADQLYAQLSSSDANFAELAKKYSTDPSGKTSGGDLGVVNRTSLVKQFADVAFSEPVGVVSKPTKSQFGWHLIEAEGPGPAEGHASARQGAEGADPQPARREGAPEAHRGGVRRGRLRAQQGHHVRARLLAGARGLAVTGGAAAPGG